MPGNFDYVPPGFRLQIKYPDGSMIDRTFYTDRQHGVRITRPRPRQNGTADIYLWVQGGAITDPQGNPSDWCEVFLDDITTTPLYTRYFHGYARVQQVLDGNANQGLLLDCVDLNWRFKNPPAMPIVKTRVGAPPIWLPEHPYQVNDEMQPWPPNGRKYIATVGGTSGKIQPALSIAASANSRDLVGSYYDSFNRGNSTTSLGSADDGGTYTVGGTATFGIRDNMAIIQSISSRAFAWRVTTLSDVIIQLGLPVLGDGKGICFRMTDANNGLEFVQNGSSNYLLKKIQSGTPSTLGTAAVTPSATDVLKVSAVGTAIKCYINGTELISVTSSFNQTAVRHGLAADVATSIGAWDQIVISNATAPSVQWVQNGSNQVSDVQCINDILDIYFPQALFPHTRTDINSLIASVPSIEIQETWTADDALQAVADQAVSTRYYFPYPSWQASTAYSAANRDEVEPTTVIGLVFQVYSITGAGLSGGSQPAWNTTIGGLTTDNQVTWLTARRVGHWEPSVPVALGQRIEPDGAHLNGYYLDVVVPGITGASVPAWGTPAIGATVTTGTAILQYMGRTGVVPFFQWDMPPDNVGHTAPWTPNFSWRNSNSTDTASGGITLYPAAYSDEIPADTLHVHYKDIKVASDGNTYRNAWYVHGRNSSFAIATDDDSIQNYKILVAGAYADTSDTGPSTNSECYAIAQARLATSIMRRTLSISSADPIDPGIIRKIAFGKFENDVLGLPALADGWPLTEVGLTLGMEGTEWTAQAGAPFLTSEDDPYEIIPGGPEYIYDNVPPEAVFFETNPSSPNYWIIDNTAYFVNQQLLVSTQIQWLSGNERDLWFFDVFAQVQGEFNRRYLGRVYYPTQNLSVPNLLPGNTVSFYVSATDRRGNVLKDPNGQIIFSHSPDLTVPQPTVFPPTSLQRDTAGFPPAGYVYRNELFADIHLSFTPPAAPFVPEGYVCRVTAGGLQTEWVFLDGAATGLMVENRRVGVAYTYELWAYVGGYVSTSVSLTHTVPAYAPPAAPTIGTITHGYNPHIGYFLSIPVSHSGDHSEGGVVITRPASGSGFETETPIPRDSAWPVTVLVGRQVTNVSLRSYAIVYDQFHLPSAPSTPVDHTITNDDIGPLPKPPNDYPYADPFGSATLWDWFPKSPSVNADYTFVSQAVTAAYNGTRTLQATVPSATTKEIESFDISVKPGEVWTFETAAKLGTGAGGTSPSVSSFIRYYNQNRSAQVGTDQALQAAGTVGTGGYTSSGKKQFKIPAGAYRAVIVQKAVGSGAGGTGTYTIYWGFPFIERAKTVEDTYVQPSPTIPEIIYDDFGNPVYYKYWSPAAQCYVFVPVGGNPNYTAQGLEFRDQIGSMTVQEGTLKYDQDLDIVGRFLGTIGTPLRATYLNARMINARCLAFFPMNLIGGAGGSSVTDISDYWRQWKLTQATAGNKGTAQDKIQNRLRILRLDGTNDYYKDTAFSPLNGTNAYTLMAIFKVTNAGNNQGLVWGQSETCRMQQFNNEIYAGVGTGVGRVAFTGTDWNVWTAVYDGSASGDSNRLKLRKNGTGQTLTYDASIPATAPASNGLALGTDYSVNVYMGGDFGLLVFWDKALGTDDLQIQERSWGSFWGITVA